MVDIETKRHWLREYFFQAGIIFFGSIITGITGYAGFTLIDAIETNTKAIDDLTKSVVESSLVNNTKFNMIDSRFELGREKSQSAYRELRGDIDRNIESIKEIKQELRK